MSSPQVASWQTPPHGSEAGPGGQMCEPLGTPRGTDLPARLGVGSLG